ncbi:hypothetical protein [Terasakiella sp.]|uniref:hypothetical protein n=1 Tax=Terasakiella sp. TaxID=2034861 RepID=UPI003AA9DE35
MELKLSSRSKPLVKDTRKPSPQQIMERAIEAQLGLLSDPNFTVKKYRYVDDYDSEGNKTKVKRMTSGKPKCWWWLEGDTYYLELRYGSYIFELKDGMSSIICGSTKDDVAKVLRHIRDNLLRTGKLDDRLIAAKDWLRRKP